MISKKYIKKAFLLALTCLLFSCGKEEAKTIDLAGTWNFKIDSLDQGMTEKWYTTTLGDTIKLPGSMAQRGKGDEVSLKTHWTGSLWNDSLWYKTPKYEKYRQPGNIKIDFWLTPNKVYYGPAWYQKKVTVPEDWKGQQITFSLERAHWESTLFVDDKELGMRNVLGTPHTYDLSDVLTPGEHTLTVRMDNRVKEINVGVDAHSISDNTQTNWNGMVGAISLTATPRVFVDQVKIVPDVANKQLTVKLKIENKTGTAQKGTLSLTAKGANGTASTIATMTEDAQLKEGLNEITLTYPMGDDPALWSEFDPNTYHLEVELKTEKGTNLKTVDFGMREFKVDGKHFAINGHPVFLRGTLECAIFPLTGYPPTDEEAWLSIFKIIKAHGLNHMRFHSWCPPEAAFKAADASGIYLQVEASAWATIGDGKPVDKWLYKEAQNILDTYGNHPSFVMMAYGNEPSGKNHKEYLIDFVDHFKKMDSTKVFTSAAGWPLIDNTDFFNTPKPRIQQWNQNLNSIINSKPPQTVFDYRDIIDNTPMPVVSHEIGQWCVYPNFEEMSKYTGVLKPKNFEIFKETLEANHMGELADSLLLASGKLQTLCYKADIEASLRTKGFAGFQLLDLHDFPGQGTALIGVLDAFWEEKGYVSPEEFRAFSGPTVPLARMEKRIFSNTDNFEASVEIAHFGKEPLKEVVPKWKLVASNGDAFAEGDFDKKDIELGNGIPLGTISLPLDKIKKAQQLTLSVTVADFTNTWDIWVYPAEKSSPIPSQGGGATPANDLRVVKKLDARTINFLQKGGSVLLNPDKGALAYDKGGDIGIGFSSIFWNTSWTNEQKPHTLGILCDPKNPALSDFPTQYHANWQWWDAMSHSNAIILDDFSPHLKPIVRVVDDWFKNRRLALLFEVKVGEGKLLVSGIDLHTDLDDRLEAQQLLYSLKNYMVSDTFNPKVQVEASQISSLYAKSK